MTIYLISTHSLIKTMTYKGINDRTGLTLKIPQNIPLKDALKIVPEYDSTDIPSSTFLGGYDKATSINALDEQNLIKLLGCMLKGEARLSVERQNFKFVEEFKDYPYFYILGDFSGAFSSQNLN